jgi:prophage regulatory protein
MEINVSTLGTGLLEFSESLGVIVTIPLPATGYLRQKVVLGDKKANPPVPAIIPVCPSTWWKGIKKGIYPAPVKLSENVTAWRVEDIRALIDRINNQGVVG